MGSDAGADQAAAAPEDGASEPDATGSGVDALDDVVTKMPDSGGQPGDAAPGDASGVDGEVPSYSVSCGMTTTCEAPGQFCCVSGLPTPMYACESDPTGCVAATDAQIYCTSSAQCPGAQVCCGHVLSPAVVTCQATCNGANDYVFCDPSAPNDCPQGHKCVASTRIVGYDRCN